MHVRFCLLPVEYMIVEQQPCEWFLPSNKINVYMLASVCRNVDILLVSSYSRVHANLIIAKLIICSKTYMC